MALTSPPDSCLVVSLDNIGDLVFASALLAPLRAAWPSTRFGVWCKDYARDVAALLPGAPQVHAADPVWDRAPGRGRGRWQPFLTCLREIRRERYRVALIASRQWRAACAAACAGAGDLARVGYDGPKARWWLTEAIARPTEVEPVTRELARLLTPLVEATAPLRYELDGASLTPARARIAGLRQGLGHVVPYVALHAFAGHPRRCLALDTWLELARAITAQGASALWIGTKGELARIRAAAGATACSFEYADDYGDGHLVDAAALIAGAASFVGHDSGPLHIAGGLGVPALGLYLPGEPDRTLPQGVGKSRVIIRSSPEGLTAEAVLASLIELQAAVHA
jgi:ADP-heptose:LPS heptosyltransferase